MENPYASPETTEAAPQQRVGVRPWLAVLVGLAIDFGGTLVMSIAMSIVMAIYLASRGLGPDAMQEQLTAMFTTGVLSYVMTGLGLLISLVAGYVAARMAKRNELRVGTIQATISTLVGSLALLGSEHLLWLTVLLLVGFGAVLGGAAFGARHNRAAISVVEQTRP